MVKLCPDSYPIENEPEFQEHFQKYEFPLSPFQKYSIQSIVEGNHALVCAHTGSGKTLPAEFAIEYFASQGKKVIYTSPIKALSNQKFYEFTKKFPHISFGILTGDIKTNPEADVLIMTTEILLNKLYQVQSPDQKPSGISFDMSIHDELACVIFDEIHYINDPERGNVWEQSIMLLPRHVQMVMLSATIDAPEKFAGWCETRGDRETEKTNQNKVVYLTTTNHRVVPLTHYSFITTTNAIYKVIKDKQLEKEIREQTNALFVMQDAAGKFNDINYNKMKKILTIMETKQVYMKRAHILNQVCKHMVEHNMLPALCFVLSRKQLEQCAKEITVPLLEDDSKVGYIVRRECEQIIRKLPNFQEYLQLPEYNDMVYLLEKGIAIHHAGVMPVLREMVELLYAKGYIKLLFATETFAVGINMPTKTVLFTDVKKFDGSTSRMLYSHEYTQMAGRAGRRGIDTVGHVIHLNNLFKNVELTEYKNMMHGKPQTLVSKFKISYNLILNLVEMGDQQFTQFAQRSMIQDTIQNDLACMEDQMTLMNQELDRLKISLQSLRTTKEIVDEYIGIKSQIPTAVNKKRKELERRQTDIEYEYKFIAMDVQTVNKYNQQLNLCNAKYESYKQTQDYLNSNVVSILRILEKEGFVSYSEEKLSLTIKGSISTRLREVHCLAFGKLVDEKKITHLSAPQLAAIFSCFTNVTVADEIRSVRPRCKSSELAQIIQSVDDLYKFYQDTEFEENVVTGTNYNIHFDIIEYVMEWCECESAEDCKRVLQKMEQEKGVFLGEFIKALLKINNIASEMEGIAEAVGEIAFLSSLREIQFQTLKYVATNQSLYI